MATAQQQILPFFNWAFFPICSKVHHFGHDLFSKEQNGVVSDESSFTIGLVVYTITDLLKLLSFDKMAHRGTLSYDHIMQKVQ